MEKLEPITREEKFMAAAAGDTTEKLTPITRKEKFLARIAENAENAGSGGGGTGGGAQADYLAKEGEPGYILNRDKIQEKICETKIVELLPETTFELALDEESGIYAAMMPVDFGIIIGSTYHITYNGEKVIAQASDMQGPALAINQDYLIGVTDDEENGNIMIVLQVNPEAATTLTFALEKEEVSTIPSKYKDYRVDFEIETMDAGEYNIVELADWAEVVRKLEENVNVILTAIDSGNKASFVKLYYGGSGAGRHYFFGFGYDEYFYLQIKIEDNVVILNIRKFINVATT